MRPLLFLLAFSTAVVAAPGYKAGTATKVITPAEPLWMAGYASRNKPGEVKRHDLWVKALALEDAAGNRCVLLTSDLCGIPRSLSEPVCAEVTKRTGLKREQIMLTCSHTHSGPVVDGNLTDMYDLTPGQPEKIRAYTDRLRGWMIDALVAAVKDLQPATLSTGQGTARFAMNRRQAKDKGVVIGQNPDGPVDHSVPVLKVETEKGVLKALVFGYACHNTTMDFYEWCGDYAGFAQVEIEKKHPGAVALFWSGCGADANPNPRRQIELCEKFGKELAGAVGDVLKAKTAPLTADVVAKYQEIKLGYAAIPGKETWQTEAQSKTHAIRIRAEKMLQRLDAGSIPDHYAHYPIQVWRFGDQLIWAALGGEVVVDYAWRLKKELPGTVWVTAYANDVVAYIPSERVLKEGGYEADSSQIYYGHPTKWAPGLEARIVTAVRDHARGR